MRIALHPQVHDHLEGLRAGWQIARPGLTYSMVIEFMLSDQEATLDNIRAFEFVSKEVGRPTTPRLQQSAQPTTDTEAELGSKESRAGDSDDRPG